MDILKNSAKRIVQLNEFQELGDVDKNTQNTQNTEALPDSMAVIEQDCQKRVCTVKCPPAFFHWAVAAARLNTAEKVFKHLTRSLFSCLTTFWRKLPKFTGLNQYLQSEKVVITGEQNLRDLQRLPNDLHE